MDVYEFIWDTDIVEKLIVKHRVLPEEAEQVFQSKTSIRNHRGVYMALGKTLAGRHLFVVFKRGGEGALKIITARDMTIKEKRLYQKEI